jgi:asparagine synthase (glutamine-hydrolysing)
MYLLRKAAEKVIPKEIIKRNKVGFYTPIDKWFQEDFNGIAKAVLLDTSSACSNYFHCSYMESLLDDHKSGRVNNGEKLWNLLVFEIWHKRFINSGFRS